MAAIHCDIRAEVTFIGRFIKRETSVAINTEEAFSRFEVAHLWVELSDFVNKGSG